MKTIAVTGNMGSGKTMVSHVFESLGIPAFYADTEAKKLYSLPEIKLKVRSLFGDSVFENRLLSFLKLAEKVFADESALKKLETIIHPAVVRSFQLWAERYQDEKYVIMENAVLFEGGFDKLIDIIIFVSCPAPLRVRRIAERDNSSHDTIVQRMKHQWEEDRKIPLSHYVIINDNKQALLPQIHKITEELDI
jgi:dephospho-CoA kinase